jgi:hypothetical protein
MILIHEFKVVMVEVEALRLYWTIEPTAEDISEYDFSVLRSGAESGPWQVIASSCDQFFYIDRDANNYSSDRIYWYSIRITHKPTNKYKDFGPQYNSFDTDPVGLELIRKKNVYLRTQTGLPVFLFKKKTFGQYCPNCWDKIKQRVSKTNCEVCFGTGYAGGYWKPIELFVNRAVPDNVTKTIGFNKTGGASVVEASSHPIISPGDFILYPQVGTRHRVVSITAHTRMGDVISQYVNLTEINKSDIEYRVA